MKAVLMSARGLFVVQLVLGILFWTNTAGGGLIAIHMLIGIIFVALIWAAGVIQVAKGGTFGLVGATFVVGLIVALFGLFQAQLLPGGAHWLIQVVHLLLGLAALGTAEACAASYKRRSVAVPAAVH